MISLTGMYAVSRIIGRVFSFREGYHEETNLQLLGGGRLVVGATEQVSSKSVQRGVIEEEVHLFLTFPLWLLS